MLSKAQYQVCRRGGGRRSPALALAALLSLLAAIPEAARAEKAPSTRELAPARSLAPAPAIPDAYKLNMLIRTTLIALSQANQTGNYSVLRDLGTQQFQAVNTDARLAEIFAGLRQRNLDLSPILFFDPKLVREPVMQGDGMLRMTGFLDTKPERVLFDIGFQSVQGQWRLSAIVVDIKAPTAETAEPAAPSSKDAASKNATKAKAKPAKSPASANAP